MKLLLVSFLVCSTIITGAVALNCEGGSHNEVFGQRQHGDKLINQDHIKESWKFLRYATKSMSYPLQGQLAHKITYIEIQDQYTNGHGGCAYITEGGIGERFVKVHFKSQFNRGIDFEIFIYGIA